MAENARSWSSLISVSVAKSASTARLGTTTDTSVSLLMASAAVMSKTDWPIAKANVRHTMGSSRNNNKRGVKVGRGPLDDEEQQREDHCHYTQ